MRIFKAIGNFFKKTFSVFDKFFKETFTDSIKKFINMYIEDAITAAKKVEELGVVGITEKQSKWWEIFKEQSKANPKQYADRMWNLLRELAVTNITVKF